MCANVTSPDCEWYGPAAREVTADRDPDDDRRAERPARAPARRRELVADLQHRGPDVVEELDLDDRLQPARGPSDRPADDARLGEGRIEDARGPELLLEAGRHLEDAALALAFVEDVFAARVGDVLAPHRDARDRAPSRRGARR